MAQHDDHLDDFNDDALLDGLAVPTGLDRREFVRLVTAAAAFAGVAGAGAATASAQGRAGGAAGQGQTPPPLPPLGNGEPPAMMFQAYPGGTGALLERLAKERGRAAFDRSTFAIEPWSGPVPGKEEDIAFLPVHRLAALIKARKITSVDLTNIYLERLKRYNPLLLCAVTIMDGQAREAAQQADAEIKAGKYRGPLHGIPWGVKDLFSTKGVPTTWGYKDFEHRIIDVDSEVVVRMRDAGAVLVAKLSTGLFAQNDSWFRGQTKNPWDTTKGSSGSSAGPSSATAAGCVAFGIGTETQGSIVSPATQCGLSALRPTFGRVSRYGGMVLAWSMDKVGPICRTVEDCALVFNAIHGADEKDPSTLTAPFQFDRKVALSKLRIGFDAGAPKPFLDKLTALGATLTPMKARPQSRGSALNAEGAAAFDFLVMDLVARGLTTLPPAGAAAPPAAAPPVAAPAAAADAAAAGRAGGGRGGAGRGGAPDFSTGGALGVVPRFTSGRNGTALDFLQGQRRRLILMHEMAEVMKDVDMYVTANGDVGLTNQTGHPACVVQCGMREDRPGPQVVTIVGQLFADDKILSVANAYQSATDWHTKRPDIK
jgi:Asp-tRNA(Asn)/Glu-tRNA(Gln) amidotransferase A subunit family amidase